MAGLLKITAIGNVGSEPEQRYTPQGRAVTSFSLACNRTYTKDGEKQEEVEWLRVSCWGNLADVASQYVVKGRELYIEGRLATHSYEAANGEKRFSLDVTASELHLIGGKRDNADSPSLDYAPSARSLDEVPF